MRNKWDHPRGSSTYGEQTIARALATVTEYKPHTGRVIVSGPSNSIASASENHCPFSVKPPPASKIWTAAELYNTDLPPIEWLVQEVFPKGLVILAAAPKVGKSLLTLGLALDIARGGKTFGDKIDIAKGETLILALENSAYEIKALLHHFSEEIPTAEVKFVTISDGGWDRFDFGGLARLDKYLDENSRTQAVVIDTWARVKPDGSKTRNAYENDTAAVAPVAELAKRRRVTVILVNPSHALEEGAVTQ